MEAADLVDVTKSPNTVEHGRLTTALIMTVQIIISLVMFTIVVPFFILWRVPISLLYFTKKEKEEPKNADQEREKQKAKDSEEAKEDEKENDGDKQKPPPSPPKDAHERAVGHYNEVWGKFRDRPINAPLVKYWSRIAATTLLVIQTILSLAVLYKSLVYHIPWFVKHLSNTEYKTTKKKEWWNDFLLHAAGMTITCAPFMGLIGVGIGILYYSAKVWKYGKFQQGAVRRKGGRGYDDPEEKKKKDEDEEGRGVKEAIMEAVDHVMHPHLPHLPHPNLPDLHLHMHPHAGHELRQGQPEDSPYGNPEYSEDILFEQPGGGPYGHHDVVQPPPPVTMQSPKRTVWYDKNPYTLAGIASIWTGKEEKMKTGYNGRGVRRRNFEEDIEMADRAGSK